MRLPLKSTEDFIKELNSRAEKISTIFVNSVENITKKVPVKVMLGDNTVTEQLTFDPILVNNFYQKLVKNLPDWTTNGISVSNNEGLRRAFIKFEVREGNYLLKLHLSLQYHVLLYYKLDSRVPKVQKELSDILDKTKSYDKDIATIGDQVVLEKLREIGYKDLDEQKLFEIFFTNEKLSNELNEKIHASNNKNLKELMQRKSDLLKELDGFLIETYQTSSVLIDETKLIAGEEGAVCQVELEFIKNKIREAIFDHKKIPERIKEKLFQRFDELSNTMSA